MFRGGWQPLSLKNCGNWGLYVWIPKCKIPVLWLTIFSASSWTEGETRTTLKVLPWRHSTQCLAHSKHSINVRNSALGVLGNPASMQQKLLLLNIRKILLLKHCLLKKWKWLSSGICLFSKKWLTVDFLVVSEMAQLNPCFPGVCEDTGVCWGIKEDEGLSCEVA